MENKDNPPKVDAQATTGDHYGSKNKAKVIPMHGGEKHDHKKDDHDHDNDDQDHDNDKENQEASVWKAH